MNTPTITPIRSFDGIDCYNVCDVCPDPTSTFAEDLNTISEFCVEFDAAYYSAPREDFSYAAAVQQAQSQGKTRVIVEDMS